MYSFNLPFEGVKVLLVFKPNIWRTPAYELFVCFIPIFLRIECSVYFIMCGYVRSFKPNIMRLLSNFQYTYIFVVET